MRYYIHLIQNDQWQKLLAFYLAKADTFKVHFPEDSGNLSFGKSEFLKLQNITTSPWRGKKHSIEITGELSSEAVDLFVKLESDFHAAQKLWDYQLLEKGNEVLYLADNMDCIVEADDEDLKKFQKLGITIDKWKKLKDSSEGTDPLPFNEEQIIEFTEMFVKLIEAKNKKKD